MTEGQLIDIALRVLRETGIWLAEVHFGGGMLTLHFSDSLKDNWRDDEGSRTTAVCFSKQSIEDSLGEGMAITRFEDVVREFEAHRAVTGRRSIFRNRDP